jgi:hypothetical protein
MIPPSRPATRNAIWSGIAEGYVQPTAEHPGAAFELTAKAIAFLGERGAGLNEA